MKLDKLQLKMSGSFFETTCTNRWPTQVDSDKLATDDRRQFTTLRVQSFLSPEFGTTFQREYPYVLG